MSKLKVAMAILQEFFHDGNMGLFNKGNNVGDLMDTVYNDDGLIIKICYQHSYFEVFGLSADEFRVLKRFYKRKGGLVL